MRCNDLVFEDFLSNCNDDILLNAELVPGATYSWQIRDKNKNVYSNTAVADAYGTSITIPVTDPELPVGLINSYGGTFTLQLFDAAGKLVMFKMALFVDTVFFNTIRGTLIKKNLGESL